jgi:hypothetical protein
LGKIKRFQGNEKMIIARLGKSRLKFNAIIILAIVFAVGCTRQSPAKEEPKSEATTTLEETLKIQVNNPIDSAIKLHKVKNKLEEEVGAAQDKYNDEMKKAVQESE